MKLHIAGVNHNDPLGRERLKKWLEKLSVINDKSPAFVAVEYDNNIFEQIKKQRKRFRQLLQNEWSFLSPVELDIVENSLAYDGDTHLEVFPNAEILWLDKNRNENDTSWIDRYAEVQLNVYKQYSFNKKPLFLNWLSGDVCRNTPTASQSTSRDQKFARLILKKVSRNKSTWAIAIVGSDHTKKDIQGSMRCLLENAGLTCEVTVLHPLV